MRNFTIKYVREKLSFTSRFRLNPFPGSCPTRVLIARKPLGEKWTDYKEPVYFGKPNAITLRKMMPAFFNGYVYLEFDRKNLVYMKTVEGGRHLAKTSPSFAFYHPYVAAGPDPWPWFLGYWHSFKVDKYAAYSLYKPELDVELSLGLLDLLKEKTKNVSVQRD